MDEGISQNGSVGDDTDDEQERITRVVVAFNHAIAVRNTELAALDDDGKYRLNFTIDNRFLKPKTKTPRAGKVEGARPGKR